MDLWAEEEGVMKRLCCERGIRRFLGGKEAVVNKTMYLACGNGLMS